MRRVLLVVAPRDQVAPYQSVADRAGLKLVGIDLEALGLLRAFVEPEAVAAALPTTPRRSSWRSGTSRRRCSSPAAEPASSPASSTGVAGRSRSAIARVARGAPAEAATILRHLSLSGPGRKYEGLDEAREEGDRGGSTAAHAVRPRARELASVLPDPDRLPRHRRDRDHRRNVAARGLGEALHAMIGVKVDGRRSARSRDRRKGRRPGIESRDRLAGGLDRARHRRRLDARGGQPAPREASRSREPARELVAIGVPVAAAVPLVALGLLYFGRTARSRTSSHSSMSVQGRDRRVAAAAGADHRRRRHRRRGSSRHRRRERSRRPARVGRGLRDLSRVLPANVWLTKLSVHPASGAATSPTGAATPSPPSRRARRRRRPACRSTGYTYSHPDVARCSLASSTLPSLTNVTLTSSQSQPSANET